MTGTPHILLVEDDTELGGLVARLLAQQPMHVQQAPTLALARQALQQRRFDALVLDIMLPDGNGLDLCRELHHSHPGLPVLMLSARGDTLDRVLGLEIGADDYLAKPFDAAELTARLRALLRRGRTGPQAAQAAQAGTHQQHGRLLIDLLARSVSIDGRVLGLTSTEYKLLRVLAEHPGLPMSREALSRSVQPGSYVPSDRSVDVQVARLRKKLRAVDRGHEWVSTVRGEGYVFTLPAAR
jgi:two-component system, OmpR family, phosphate regulon response regulator OmpR